MADTETRDPDEYKAEDHLDYDTKRGRALARHTISQIDVQIMTLQETKAKIRAKLAGKE